MEATWPMLEPMLDSTGNMTGTVHRAMFGKNPSGSEVSAHLVQFEAAARTHWHTHDGEQILIVTAGTVIVQREHQPAVRLEPGQAIRLPADERHWHGSAGGAAAHIAVNLGNTVWLEAVTDLAFDAAVKGARGLLEEA
jgi:quercetin dioxygenase-like cupin family protein